VAVTVTEVIPVPPAISVHATCQVISLSAEWIQPCIPALLRSLSVQSSWLRWIEGSLRKHQIEKLERKMKSDIKLLKFACQCRTK
jgi:hypothetical protein